MKGGPWAFIRGKNKVARNENEKTHVDFPIIEMKKVLKHFIERKPLFLKSEVVL